MVRIVLGILAGFVVWSIIWIGSDSVLRMLSPGWYGAEQVGLENAMYNQTSFTANTSVLLIGLVRSIFCSLLSGFIAAFVANEQLKAPLVLGVLLLIMGLLVQSMLGSLIPMWYNIVFLALLIPVTFLGAKLRGRMHSS